MTSVIEVVVVEGRYDKNAVHQAVDATVLETSGFGILNDKEKIAILRKLAEKRGLILLTDSDRAGFFIRGRLKGILGDINIKHAYIPDIAGCEKRKAKPSKEGKLGVEGMKKNTIIKALKHAGATFTDETQKKYNTDNLTKADLFALGLSGSEKSLQKRQDLQRHLELPKRLSANGLIDVLNILYTREEFLEIFNKYQNNIYKI